MLAAASLVVDYVLSVAVSLAAGAASLISTFPSLHGDQLELCLAGLALLTLVNLRGIAESARALMLPALLFIVPIGGVSRLAYEALVAAKSFGDNVVALSVQ